MAIKFVDHYPREQIKDFNMAKVITNNKLTVIFIKIHAGNITVKNVLQHSHWLSIASIPNFN
jgi:hypothetical protein